MTTHLPIEQIRNYVTRNLARADLVQVNEHLFDCEDCYQQFLSIFQAHRRFPIEVDLDDLAGSTAWHLQGEELTAYIEGRLNEPDSEFASLHLRGCAWCREEVENYSEFTYKLSYYLSKRHAPVKQASAWSRYSPKLLAIPAHWSPVRFAGIAALVLLLLGSAVLVLSVLRTRPEVQEKTASEPAQNNDPLQAVLPSDTSQPAQSTPSDTGTGNGQTSYSKHESDKSNPHSSEPSTSPSKRIAAESLQETELLAADLHMPGVIEIFDRSQVVLRGDGDKGVSFTVTGPYSTVISDDRPTFRWTALSGASHYTVSVYDANLNLIRTSEPLTATQWAIPNQLERGVIYTWVVTAIKDGKEVLAPTLPARAEFKIIEKSELIRLGKRVNQMHSAATRGVLYARAGLLDDAEQQLRAHLSLHPADKMAMKLLRTIKSWRGP
jgi:hypothetical protein